MNYIITELSNQLMLLEEQLAELFRETETSFKQNLAIGNSNHKGMVKLDDVDGSENIQATKRIPASKIMNCIKDVDGEFNCIAEDGDGSDHVALNPNHKHNVAKHIQEFKSQAKQAWEEFTEQITSFFNSLDTTDPFIQFLLGLHVTLVISLFAFRHNYNFQAFIFFQR